MKKIALCLSFVALAACIPYSALAHGEDAAVTQDGATGILPDSILYGIDVLFEKIGDSLTFSADGRLTRLVAHMDERIHEYSLVATAGKIKHAEKALLRYSQTAKEIEPLIEKLSDDTVREARITELTTKIMNHQETLAGVYAEAPDAAHAGIQTAIDAGEAAYQAIIDHASETQRTHIKEVKELYDKEVEEYLNPHPVPPPAAPMPEKLEH